MKDRLRTRRVGTYGSAIQWIALNDDTEWLNHEYGSPSVTLCLVADVFGRTVERATDDLRCALQADHAAQKMLEQARTSVRATIAKAESNRCSDCGCGPGLCDCDE
jgi:hypothetical protein